jgi:hypothetical protein
MKATANAALLAWSASEIKPERLNLPRCAHAVRRTSLEHEKETYSLFVHACKISNFTFTLEA